VFKLAWFDKDRRLCKNYKLLLKSFEEIVKLSAIKSLLNEIKQALSFGFFISAVFG